MNNDYDYDADIEDNDIEEVEKTSVKNYEYIKSLITKVKATAKEDVAKYYDSSSSEELSEATRF